MWGGISGRVLSAKTLLTERHVLLTPITAPRDRLLDSFRNGETERLSGGFGG